jgi:hypothetical protein
MPTSCPTFRQKITYVVFALAAGLTFTTATFAAEIANATKTVGFASR